MLTGEETVMSVINDVTICKDRVCIDTSKK